MKYMKYTLLYIILSIVLGYIVVIAFRAWMVGIVILGGGSVELSTIFTFQ